MLSGAYAAQVVLMKGQYGDESKDLTFMLMNSFSTTDDTREYLTKYEEQVRIDLPADRLSRCD